MVTWPAFIKHRKRSIFLVVVLSVVLTTCFWMGDRSGWAMENEITGKIKLTVGKSTIVKILTGIYWPDEGDVQIGGKPVRLNSPRDAWAAGVAESTCLCRSMRSRSLPQMSLRRLGGRTPGKGIVT